MTFAASLARHWPFANGAGRIIDRYAKDDLGSAERVVTVRDGFELNVLPDLIGRHLLLTGQFDRSVVQVLLDQAEPGDVLLDIGANIGYVSCVFLHQVKGSSVICIDPQPGVVDLLRKNVARFPGRAEVRQVALCDAEGELRFHVDQENRGASRVSKGGGINVPAMKAATLLRELERLDLIKIDVEGLEEPIFRSMSLELGRLKPRAILFEEQSGKAAPDGIIGMILSSLGYKVFGIKKSLLRTSLAPIRSGDDCRYNDYLALS